MKKRFKVDVRSQPVRARVRYLAIAQLALVSVAGCRQPVDTAARRELAAAHSLSLESPDRAIETLNDLQSRFPDWAEPHVHAGRLYAIEGKPEEAILALTRGIELAPESRQAALWYSRIAVATGDNATLERAREVLERQLGQDSGDVRLYHALGLLLEASGDVTGALGAYRMGTERLPETARLHLDAARIFYRLGLTGRAAKRAAAARDLSEAAGGPVYEAALRLTAQIDGGTPAARRPKAGADGGGL